jgi:CheY-like chemotaxis protein
MATNGLEAIDAFNNENPELIFMDIQMPIMNGYESAKRIRESSDDVRIIARTASIDAEHRHKCIEAGMDAYLMKPYSPADIKELVEKYI